VSALVALNVPKVTAPTVGIAWKQLIGNDIVKVATDLKYDDEYGDLFGQDWCRAIYLVADTGDLQIVDCNDLPALLAREAASAPTP
jgi:hypothetical protein